MKHGGIRERLFITSEVRTESLRICLWVRAVLWLARGAWLSIYMTGQLPGALH